MSAERCGYAITDKDGEQQPCDRPATGWRWYQDVGEHEDMLDAACDWHANEGGERIHRANQVRHYAELMTRSISVDRAEMADDILEILDGTLGGES